MALIKCPDCGNMVSDKADACPVCGKPVSSIINNDSEALPKKQESEPTLEDAEFVETEGEQQHSDSPSLEIASVKIVSVPMLIIGLLSIFMLIGGILFCHRMIAEYKILNADESSRIYVFVQDTPLWSSTDTTSLDNVIDYLPYGTEVIINAEDASWYYVSARSHERANKTIKGYVAKSDVLFTRDYILFDSIFGDSNSKEHITSQKYRMALLAYYKENNIVGAVSSEETMEYDLPYPTEDNQWQLFCPNTSSEFNSVYFNGVSNGFGVLLTNLSSKERMLVYFTLDAYGTPRFETRIPAPDQGGIKMIEHITGDKESSRYSVQYVEE